MSTQTNLDGVLAKARGLEQAGDLAGAKAALDGADAAAHGTGLWHYARGTLAFRTGQADEALALFTKAVALEPEVAEYRANLGAVLLERAKAKVPGALEQATAELEKALKWGPTLPSTRVNLGLARLLAGDAKEALACFDAALGVDAKDLAALYNRAVALEALGRRGDALAALDAALAVKPDFAPALTSKQHLSAKQGRA